MKRNNWRAIKLDLRENDEKLFKSNIQTPSDLLFSVGDITKKIWGMDLKEFLEQGKKLLEDERKKTKKKAWWW